MTDESAIDEAVDCATCADLSESCVRRFQAASAAPESAKLFVQQLVSRRIEEGTSPEDAVAESLDFFERLADRSESAACIFMIYLWPFAADQIGAHDVCNSIDLWLVSRPHPDVIRQMNHVEAADDREFVRDHFRGLLSNL